MQIQLISHSYLDNCDSCILFVYSSYFSIFIFHLARHLAFFYILIVLHSDNPGPVCFDSGMWIEEDPTIADQAYFEE